MHFVSRRKLFGVLAVGPVILLEACSDEEKRPCEKLTDDVRSQVDKVKDAIDSAKSSIGDFEVKTWRDDIDEIESRVDAITDAVEELDRMVEAED